MRVLITGITGQDGSYLAQHLSTAGDEIFGLVRSNEHHKSAWIRSLVPEVKLVVGDLLDQSSLERVLYDVQPDEIYNLAAVTSPGGRWGTQQPPLLAEVTALGVVRLLNTMRVVSPETKLVHASSSAIYSTYKYGLYGSAKKFAHDAVVGYRDGFGLHASNAVFFSHTSPRQHSQFLIRKIIKHVKDIATGNSSTFQATNISNKRDWGYAPDYVKALPLMARKSDPHDYDVCTGEVHSIRDVVSTACKLAHVSWDDVSRAWSSVSYDTSDVEIRGDSQVTHSLLGWTPSTSFSEMIELLLKAEQRT